MSFNVVSKFEQALAKWWGAPYAVATDCCTHAIELCLLHRNIANASCPAHTYISIPFTFRKLDIGWHFREENWCDYYAVAEGIYDSAVYWQKGGYTGGLQCLSFQFKKPLNLGRGGAILCETESDYVALKKLTYDGRYGDTAWMEQDIDSVGYHYYMTPETAEQGLLKLPSAWQRHTKQWTWRDYPYLPDFRVFK